jgi:hypothetical protein
MSTSEQKIRSMSKIWNLFDEYAEEVNTSLLSDSSKKDYLMFAEMFVRWLDGDFVPGGTLR